MSFLKDYEPVEDRLRAFWEDHPEGRINTELVHVGDDGYIVKASVWKGDQPAVTGVVEFPENASREQFEAARQALDEAAARRRPILVTNGVSWKPTEIAPDATGYAQEAVTDRGVNATSALENCETSAIGRALANLGYAAKGKRPSREEMSKTSPPPAAGHGSGPESGGDTTSPVPSSTGGPREKEKAPEQPAPAGGPAGAPGGSSSDSPSGSSPRRSTIPANKCDHSVGVDEDGRCMACLKPMGKP